MRHQRFLPVIALVLAAACGGSPYAKAAEKQLDLQRDRVAILETIKDASSAKAAVPKLDALQKRMEQMATVPPDLAMPSEGDMKALEKLNQEQLELDRREQAATTRIFADPAIVAAMDEAMASLKR